MISMAEVKHSRCRRWSPGCRENTPAIRADPLVDQLGNLAEDVIIRSVLTAVQMLSNTRHGAHRPHGTGSGIVDDVCDFIELITHECQIPIRSRPSFSISRRVSLSRISAIYSRQ